MGNIWSSIEKHLEYNLNVLPCEYCKNQPEMSVRFDGLYMDIILSCCNQSVVSSSLWDVVDSWNRWNNQNIYMYHSNLLMT